MFIFMEVMTRTVWITIFMPMMFTAAEPIYEPEKMLGSPENILSLFYSDDEYWEMLVRADAADFNALYAIGHGEDDPLLDPFLPNGTIDYELLAQYRKRIQWANDFGMRVHFFLHEEETMGDSRWPIWYAHAVQYLDDLDIVFVISEEYNQEPHALSVAEVEDRCSFLKDDLGTRNQVGVHDVGNGTSGLKPFIESPCIDVLHVQWYTTRDPFDAIRDLGPTTKYVIVSEGPTTGMTAEEWCPIARDFWVLGLGFAYYDGNRDQDWQWYDIPHC